MKRSRLLISLLGFLTLVPLSVAQQGPRSPPATRGDNVQEVLHGVTIVDPYRWREDQNSPETRAWIDAQNAYTHARLDSWPGRPQMEKRATELRREPKSGETAGIYSPRGQGAPCFTARVLGSACHPNLSPKTRQCP